VNRSAVTSGNAAACRRSFLYQGSLLLGATAFSLQKAASLFAGDPPRPHVRAGLLTDVHYADKKAAGTRYYRESIRKLDEATGRLADTKPDFVVELGDLIDAADSVAAEKRFLRTINDTLTTTPAATHYVLGNHCVYTLTKEEFLGEVGRPRSYDSFDAAGYHFVVLDACFRSDGVPYGRKNFDWTDANLPQPEIAWLQADLAASHGPVLLFIHQRLDVENHFGVKNATAVRKVLEASGRVLAVFQGHSHQNEHQEIAGIHYCTLAAVVEGSGTENNAYATLEIYEDDLIRVRGFRRQATYRWT